MRRSCDSSKYEDMLKIYLYQGSKVDIKKVFSSRNCSFSITTLSLVLKSDIGYANTRDFFDLAH